MWREAGGWTQTPDLQRAARDWLVSAGAQHTLVMQQGRSHVWAWGSRSSPFDETHLEEVGELPAQLRLVVGLPGYGAEGFKRSHADAVETSRVVAALRSALRESVTTYRSVTLLSLVTADLEAATRFVDVELGKLALADRYTAEIRKTLRTFLESHSPQATAHQMHLARNTVNYRLRRAEELLGRPLSARQLQLWLALVIAESLEDRPG